MEMPAKKPANKWLLGLGIGCGGIVVLGIIIGIAGYFFVRTTTQGFRDSDELVKSLIAKYGRVEDYCPDPSGAIPAGRMEVFLAVRDATAASRAKLEESLEVLAKSRDAKGERGRSLGTVVQALRTGVGMIPQISDYLKSRAQALLDREMGAGEYTHIYVAAYYSWLKKSPTDGAGYTIEGPGNDPTDPDDRDALTVSRDMTLLRMHRLVLPMLQCQLAKLGGGGAGGPQKGWPAALAAEVKAMEADRYRLPWPDGVPAEIESSLRPFRGRLEAAYSRVTNIFELAFERR